MAARSIGLQARAAHLLGFDRIAAYAVGNHVTAMRSLKEEQWSGYWVWPRLGFDGAIPEATKLQLSPKFQSYNLLSQLMETEEGQGEWLLHGDDVAVRFDPRPDSASWKLFNRYTAKHAIKI